MDFKLDEVIEDIRIVDQERNYWFTRTYGGALYDEFYSGNYVGIGLNSVPTGLIRNALKNDEVTMAAVKNAVLRSYEYPLGEVTKWANQLVEFHHAVKVGDVVVMPSENSEEYAFGLIESETYQSKSTRTFKFKDKYESLPERRRKVKWLKKIERDELNGDLKSLSSSRLAITNANSYRDVIEGCLSAVYIRENKLYLTIQIDQEEAINAFAFNEFLSGLTYFYSELCKENGEEYNEELFLKIKVQSKGKVALTCLSIFAGVGLAGLVALSDNSEVKMDLGGKVKVEGKSTGYLKSLTKFLDANQERRHREELFQDSMKRLKAGAVSEPVGKEEDHYSNSHLELDTLKQIKIREIGSSPSTNRTNSKN